MSRSNRTVFFSTTCRGGKANPKLRARTKIAKAQGQASYDNARGVSGYSLVIPPSSALASASQLEHRCASTEHSHKCPALIALARDCKPLWKPRRQLFACHMPKVMPRPSRRSLAGRSSTSQEQRELESVGRGSSSQLESRALSPTEARAEGGKNQGCSFGRIDTHTRYTHGQNPLGFDTYVGSFGARGRQASAHEFWTYRDTLRHSHSVKFWPSREFNQTM